MSPGDNTGDGQEPGPTGADSAGKAASEESAPGEAAAEPSRSDAEARGGPSGDKGRLVGRLRARLRGVLSRLRARLPKTRRGKILFYGAAAIFGVSFVGGMGVAVWSSFPSFCKSCHHITPYYESWKTSVHGKEHVACTDCHFTPGAWPYLKGKMNGMVEVFKYFSHSYGPKLRSEVKDVSCLRPGCHAREELDEKVKVFRGARFTHSKHAGGLRGGIELRCASCHSQSLHTEKGTVSAGMCFSCHLAPAGGDEPAEAAAPASAGKLRRLPAAAGSQDGGTEPVEGAAAARVRAAACETCHDVPKEVVTGGGFRFDHGKYASKGSDCSSCHSHVTHGEGRVAARQCELCHNEGTAAEREEFEKRGAEGVAEVHGIHVHEAQVECFECHDEILHGPGARAAAASKSCDACHDASHSATRALYEGSGGAVEGEADAMAASGVRCEGCHKGEKRGRLASAVCTPCHEKEYDALGARWKAAFEVYVAKLEAAAGKAAALELGPEARASLEDAGRDIAFVRDGRGVHNVKLAIARLRAAQEVLGRLPGHPRTDAADKVPAYEKEAERCLERCHLGVETIGLLGYADREMPHGSHVVSARVACSECHDMDPERHKETLADVARNCGACHHREATVGDGDCASCHPRQDAVYRGRFAGEAGPRPSEMARGKVECRECHVGIAEGHLRDRVRDACAKCHKLAAFGRMLDEWQDGTREAAAELDALVARAKDVLVGGAISKERGAAVRAARERALAALELVRADGSAGSHNLEYLNDALAGARKALLSALE